jgi:cation transporter-like permease
LEKQQHINAKDYYKEKMRRSKIYSESVIALSLASLIENIAGTLKILSSSQRKRLADTRTAKELK